MKTIEGEDNFSKLCNKYMGLLSDVEIVFSPHYFSMKEYQVEKVFEPKTISRAEELTFQLTILSNSLRSIRDCIIGATDVINEYIEEYNADWRHYSSVNRVATIQEYGGEDEDYNSDGSIKFRDDSESLKSYTIHAELSRFIESNSNQTRGEYVGTSHPSHFYELSMLAANKHEYSVMAFFREKGNEIPEYKFEDGKMIPVSTIERIEKEGYQDLLNHRTVEIFNYMLLECQEISAFFQTIDPYSDSKDQYTELLGRLNGVLNISLE